MVRGQDMSVRRNSIDRQLDLLDVAGEGADFSIDRRHRYRLWREWDSTKGCAVFVGLNPSTADEKKNDPTVRRCVNYAKAWGYGRMVMLNIFSFRATDPKVMKAEPDPVGPDNDNAIIDVAKQSDLIVLCWGSHGGHLDRGRQVAMLLAAKDMEMYCFGITAAGHPKHPLYLKKSLRPVLFEGYT